MRTSSPPPLAARWRPTLPPEIHSLAAVANAAALLLVILFWADRAVLCKAPSLPASTQPSLSAPGRASCAVLILIDGLRDDVASDPRIMPAICELAAKGGRGSAQVQSLIPSTVAGVTTLATGQVPAPVSFVHDFAAPPVVDGGLFQCMAGTGGHSFVAGPRLWNDLFGAWIEFAGDPRALESDDQRTLRDATGACKSNRYRLVVAHFVRTDSAAHAFGSNSPEYADAARWCDRAVAGLVAACDGRACVVVTADHGMTPAGGHAGREASVVTAPLIVAGPGMPTGWFGAVKQRDVPAMIAHALKVPSQTGARLLDEDRTRRASAGAGRIGIELLLVSIGLVGLARVAVGVCAGIRARREATLLNAALWPALACIIASWLTVAAALACAALAAAAWMTRPATIDRRVAAFFGAAFGAGILLAFVRLADGQLTLAHPATGSASIARMVVVLVGMFAVGRWLARRSDRSPTLCGIAVLVCLAVGERLIIQSASLSTIDLRLAFRLAEGALGLPAAVAAVIGMQAMPTIALLAGIRSTSKPLGMIFLAALFTSLSAEATACAAVLAISASPDVQSLALGCFLRTIATLAFLGVGLALLIVSQGSLTRAPADDR